MNGTDSWQLARVSVTTRATDGDYEEWDEVRADKLNVVVEGRLGSTLALYGPDETVSMDRLIAEAVEATRGGPRQPGGITPTPIVDGINVLGRDHLHALPWLEILGEDSIKLEYQIVGAAAGKSAGGTVEKWTRWGVGKRVLARTPESALVCDSTQPTYSTDRWLIPPFVLSQILLETVLLGLLTDHNLRRWPNCDVLDPGWGGSVDMEGVVRRPQTFVRAAQVVGKPADTMRAWTEGRSSTGHAGTSGTVVRDLAVGSPEPDQELPDGALVVDGMCLTVNDDGSDAAIALSPLDRSGRPRTVVVLFNDIGDLVDLGRWCGPWQRGAGPWTSRWLAVPVRKCRLSH